MGHRSKVHLLRLNSNIFSTNSIIIVCHSTDKKRNVSVLVTVFKQIKLKKSGFRAVVFKKRFYAKGAFSNCTLIKLKFFCI